MKKCRVCGSSFASTVNSDDLCITCGRALRRLNGYAVPVVRCKDCKHRHESEFCECRDDDAFCSDGETS